MRQQRRSSALNSGLFTEHSYLADSNDYNGAQDFTCSIDPPPKSPPVKSNSFLIPLRGWKCLGGHCEDAASRRISTHGDCVCFLDPVKRTGNGVRN